MRQYIAIVENALDDPDSDLSVDVILQLRPQLAAAAQKVYDAWEQDEDGIDDEYGAGGICQDIAYRMADIISEHGVYCTTICANDEVHVYVVAKTQEGVYEVDVPYRLYERGGGYNWTKIPNVVFTPDFVHIGCIDRNPANYSLYTDDA